MSQITKTILIQRPVEDVFAFVSNYENDPRWRSGVVEMQQTPRSTSQVGTTTSEKLRFVGMSFSTDAEVVEYIPNKKIAFRSTAAMTPAQGFREVLPSGENRTLFTYYLEVKFGGLFKLLAPVFVRDFEKRAENDLQTLKQLLESAY